MIQKCESDKILEKNKITEPSTVNKKSDPEGKKWESGSATLEAAQRELVANIKYHQV